MNQTNQGRVIKKGLHLFHLGTERYRPNRNQIKTKLLKLASFYQNEHTPSFCRAFPHHEAFVKWDSMKSTMLKYLKVLTIERQQNEKNPRKIKTLRNLKMLTQTFFEKGLRDFSNKIASFPKNLRSFYLISNSSYEYQDVHYLHDNQMKRRMIKNLKKLRNIKRIFFGSSWCQLMLGLKYFRNFSKF